MRLTYVVHRYGGEIVGGAETACRLFAERLVARGHEVSVVTSCASNYRDWSDEYLPGESSLNGVRVVRVPVVRPRDPDRFAKIHADLMEDPAHASMEAQVNWLDEMGPLLREFPEVLRRESELSDAVLFMTYLYPTTAYGVHALSGHRPCVLQPTAHDEPAIHVPFYRSVFGSADSLLFLTEEERDVTDRVFGVSEPNEVTGIGLDMSLPAGSGDLFRRTYGLDADPYILYVGRVDIMKGVSELMRYFVEFKGRNPSNLRLVIAGEQMMNIPAVEDIRYVGSLSEQDKMNGIAGSVALVQPSPYESFSIVLCEAWREKKPVLVQGYSSVLAGQSQRSQAGLAYWGFAEFEGCLRLLLADSTLNKELGANGFEYVRRVYGWDSVMERLESGIQLGINAFVEKYAQ